MTLFLALLPLLVFILLLIFLRFSLLISSLITSLLTLCLSLYVWQIQPQYLFFSLTKGFLIALDIFFIIFGAIFFLQVLKKKNVLSSLAYHLQSISPDFRIQILLLTWFFEAFLEATAGFGTNAAIVVPVLISLGLAPYQAVLLSLLGNSAPVAFGAIGTPTRIGFSAFSLPDIAVYTSLFNLIGIIIPIFIIFFLLKGRQTFKKDFLEILPFTLLSGLAFSVPSFLSSFLGQEFPSLIGSLVGTFLIYLAIKNNFLVPNNILPPPQLSKKQKVLPLSTTLYPYLLLILLLLLGKFLLSSLSIPLFLNLSFAIFNPGFILFLSALPFVFIWKQKSVYQDSFLPAIKASLGPLVVIASMSIMVQVMINSSHNFSSLPSFLELISRQFFVSSLPFWTPFVAAFGSFLTGSATLSNLMFSQFLFKASQATSYSPYLILALQAAAASAGNIIALADILAAQSVSGIKNKERSFVIDLFLPTLIYVLLLSLLGILFIRR